MLSVAELRAREFARLDRSNHVYLDYTGSALYAESQIRAHHELLREGLFGNPHSEHLPSRASTDVIDAARETLLRFLGVDARTHDVIFIANTTAAIKLVAESSRSSLRLECGSRSYRLGMFGRSAQHTKAAAAAAALQA